MRLLFIPPHKKTVEMYFSEQTLQIYQNISNKYDKTRYHPHRRYIVNPNMIHHWDRILTLEMERLSNSTNQEKNPQQRKLMLLNLGCGSGNDTWTMYNRF